MVQSMLLRATSASDLTTSKRLDGSLSTTSRLGVTWWTTWQQNAPTPNEHSKGLLVGSLGRTARTKPDLPRQAAEQAEQHLPHLLGPAGTMGTFNNRGTVVLIHGHGSHTGYDWGDLHMPGAAPTWEGSWIEALNKAGFSVAAVDHQGMGRSEGLRCYVESFQHYCDDVADFAECVHQGEVPWPGFPAGRPTFLMGISLGGGIAAHLMHQQYKAAQQQGTQPTFSGAILLAPMLDLGGVASSIVNRLLLVVASLINLVAPTLPLAAGGTDNKDPFIQQCFEECPLTSKSKATRIRNALEYLDACKRMQDELSEDGSNFPFLAFHSRDDSWTDCQGSRDLFNMSHSDDKELHVLPGDSHALTKGEARELVLPRVISWLRQHTSIPACAARAAC